MKRNEDSNNNKRLTPMWSVPSGRMAGGGGPLGGDVIPVPPIPSFTARGWMTRGARRRGAPGGGWRPAARWGPLRPAQHTLTREPTRRTPAIQDRYRRTFTCMCTCEFTYMYICSARPLSRTTCPPRPEMVSVDASDHHLPALLGFPGSRITSWLPVYVPGCAFQLRLPNQRVC